MDMNKQAPHETFRGQLITNCVAAGADLALAKDGDLAPAVIAGYMSLRLDRYIQMLEQLVDGEDLTRVQALIAERYKAGRAGA